MTPLSHAEKTMCIQLSVCNSHLVINAGNKFIDLDHMEKVKKDHNLNVDIQYLADKPLIAVQGPKAS